MEKGDLALAFRVFVLVGVIAVNWVIPARAEQEPCYSCQYGWCWELIYGSGHTVCQPHDDHCDMVGPCTIPM